MKGSLAASDGRIEAMGLSRRFGKVLAVRPFRVSIGRGGVTGLLGPNGSGKSTFLRLLLGIVPRDGGHARIDGVDLVGDGTAVRARATYAAGEVAVYGEMTGHSHLDWFLRRRGEARGRAAEIAAALELPLEKRVRGYSHGMKRMLALSAALAPNVRVRILDEPTEGLDPSRRGQILELLTEDAKNGTTILLSSHHLGEVESICDRMLFLRAGELLDESAASLVRLRATHSLRLEWSEPIATDRVHQSLARFGEVRFEERRALLFLREEDPRPALRAILEDRSLPPPAAFSFGELSLAELYRELYGAEAV